MSLARYPKYKDSGVEWLGELPAHWGLKRLRHLCECLDGLRIPLNAAERADRVGEVPYWGANSIVGYVDKPLLDEEVVLLGEDGAPFFDRAKPVAFFSQGPIWPNNHVHILRPVREVDGRFLTYSLNATDYANFIDGSTRDKLTQSAMNAIPVAAPPLPEQRAIAAFLDSETAKIDALVAEQERLIELLKEKRQAVISHAVTKGLNPNAPMKDSGVEWLGQVPAHWTLTKLKHLISSIEQGWSPQCDGFAGDPDTEWSVLKVGCVNGGVFAPTENKVLPSELEPDEALVVRAGDLLISRANTRDLVGGAAVVTRDYPRLMLCDKLYRLRFLQDATLPSFVARVLGTPLVRSRIELEATGASSSMLNIAQSVILELPLAVPPPDERAAIVQRLAGALKKLDELEADAVRAIALLQERRAALISAAVTGHIDVRGAAERSAA